MLSAVVELEWHLLVATASSGCVAVCLHPPELPAAFMHEQYQQHSIPYVPISGGLEIPILDLKRAKEKAVELAMLITNGNVSASARLLNCNRDALYVYLRKHRE